MLRLKRPNQNPRAFNQSCIARRPQPTSIVRFLLQHLETLLVLLLVHWRELCAAGIFHVVLWWSFSPLKMRVELSMPQQVGIPILKCNGVYAI